MSKLKDNGPTQDKTQVIMTKLKKMQARLGESNDEPDFVRMRQDAMKAVHLFTDVERTDEGYQVM